MNSLWVLLTCIREMIEQALTCYPVIEIWACFFCNLCPFFYCWYFFLPMVFGHKKCGKMEFFPKDHFIREIVPFDLFFRFYTKRGFGITIRSAKRASSLIQIFDLTCIR